MLLYADNAYILDPDLALKYVINERDTDIQYLVYEEQYVSVQDSLRFVGRLQDYLPTDVPIPNRSNWRTALPKAIVSIFFNQVIPILDVIRWKSDLEHIGEKSYYSVKQVISSRQYDNLPNLNKQFYIIQRDLTKARYKVNDLYAGLTIPPRGFYSRPVLEQTSKTIVARGQTSSVFSNSVRMLVRLRDGSLLELLLKNYNKILVSDYLNLVLKSLDTLIIAEPDFAKRYVFANCLDVSQGRPAYDMEKIFSTNF